MARRRVSSSRSCLCRIKDMKSKFIADIHISPLTVKELQKKGYDIIRVTDKLPATSLDKEIIQLAYQEKAVIITQDLDFSAIIAQSGLNGPSVISLRVANAKPDIITRILITVLPLIEAELREGAIVSIDEKEYRIKKLPVIEGTQSKS
jgi:predicted nuclease of predicted toxin-antitoxin system